MPSKGLRGIGASLGGIEALHGAGRADCRTNHRSLWFFTAGLTAFSSLPGVPSRPDEHRTLLASSGGQALPGAYPPPTR
jgi:hypothetical protein